MSVPASSTPKGLALAAMDREAELAEQAVMARLPERREGVKIPMHVRPTADGGTSLVHGQTGQVVSPCSSPEVAERTRDFFA